jgi:hypothetical protein
LAETQANMRFFMVLLSPFEQISGYVIGHLLCFYSSGFHELGIHTQSNVTS